MWVHLLPFWGSVRREEGPEREQRRGAVRGGEDSLPRISR
jgi:hypothetical protein